MHNSLTRLKAWLEQRHIYLNPDSGIATQTLSIAPEAHLEPYCFFNGPHVVLLTCGSFSYSQSPLNPMVSMGRYCSIARRVEIMPHPHHYAWITTSPVACSLSGRAMLDAARDLSQGAAPFRPLSTVSGERSYSPVQIGHDVWIGEQVLLKSGISIGTGAVIGAKALVTHDVPPYEIWGGSQHAASRCALLTALLSSCAPHSGGNMPSPILQVLMSRIRRPSVQVWKSAKPADWPDTVPPPSVVRRYGLHGVRWMPDPGSGHRIKRHGISHLQKACRNWPLPSGYEAKTPDR